MFTKPEHNQFPLLDISAPFMEEIVFTKEGVTKLLTGLNPFKASGPDELHPRVSPKGVGDRVRSRICLSFPTIDWFKLYFNLYFIYKIQENYI